jgi:FkbM family methyltransferase
MYIVDPTPRAKQHFEDLKSNDVSGSVVPYNVVGAQNVNAYRLDKLDFSLVTYIDAALWIDESGLKLWAPKNDKHVSYSAIDLTNSGMKNGASIDVESVTIHGLLNKFKADHPFLLKMDIEGAEIPVLKKMLELEIYPTQLLVEYDELNFPTRHSVTRIEELHQLILKHGYRQFYTDGLADVGYIKIT